MRETEESRESVLGVRVACQQGLLPRSAARARCPAGLGAELPRCCEPAGLRPARSAAAPGFRRRPGAAQSCLDGAVHAQMQTS